MHTPECQSAEFWPVDYDEIDVSTLPLKSTGPSSASINPVRFPDKRGRWLGIAGYFQGLRISNTLKADGNTGNVTSYAVGRGFVAPWPTLQGKKIDLFLFAESAAAFGLACIATFESEAAARAWCAVREESTALTPAAPLGAAAGTTVVTGGATITATPIQIPGVAFSLVSQSDNGNTAIGTIAANKSPTNPGRIWCAKTSALCATAAQLACNSGAAQTGAATAIAPGGTLQWYGPLFACADYTTGQVWLTGQFA